MMSTTNHGLRRTFAPLLSLVTTLGFSACGASYVPGEQEEVATPQEDVPADVVLAADEFCARLGNARYENWFWDKEDSVWEVAVIGLERRAELDIEPGGGFSELELVYTIEEVERVLPDLARTLRKECREDGAFIELSLRREAFLDSIPDLASAWAQSGVVMECQCDNGRDIEIDAMGMSDTRKIDDVSDERRGQ